jgi:diguanylate cyclase
MAVTPPPGRSVGAAAHGAGADVPGPPAGAPTPALLAKAALRRLALQRLEPIPAHFARAWREEGGEDRPEPLPASARQAIASLAARVLPTGPGRSALAEALAAQQWDALSRLLDANGSSPARDAQQWAELIERLTSHLERSSKLWTSGRKKDSLQRVLSSSRSDVDRLQQRLSQLLASWETDAPDDTGSPAAACASVQYVSPALVTPAHDALLGAVQHAGAVAPNSTPAQALEEALGLLHTSVQTALPQDDVRAAQVGRQLRSLALGPVGQAPAGAWLDELGLACDEVNRVLAHRHHFVDQLCRLVGELTDSLGELAEDESWVSGQIAVMNQALHGELDDAADDLAGAPATAESLPAHAASASAPALRLGVRALRSVSELLRVTRERQHVLRIERAQAREALRELVRHILQDLSELGAHTGRFTDSMGRYARVISEADTLQGLAGVVREMVDETHAVHELVSATTRRIEDEQRLAGELAARVHTLEDEIRRLSDEVSTDPLTQIANRRGLMRRFGIEQATSSAKATPWWWPCSTSTTSRSSTTAWAIRRATRRCSSCRAASASCCARAIPWRATAARNSSC